ncbi:helix-turn-helix domain-containing protein [Chryseolinea lacunae]|uniref:Helix-turn-helix transcriptional regulator n=1 Tax=Chryseolinea lacunae TaxID=2801331 RepID=A0ABS1L1Q6_9BACT|nr:helix-turn-helix transcriptional regulator [Chryseolinea lacunae]MBL0745505.1 helix-turn-helix transcriptional regulator [Chryseolinea lacunae]
MANAPLHRIKTISEYHALMGLPKPEHPLISLINLETVMHKESISFVFEFYSIALKRNLNTLIKYGQQQYDFDDGIMFFISPGQLFSIEVNKTMENKRSGWMILIHPDFFWNTPLAQKIKQYEYFSYSVNEALHLSEKEEATLMGMMRSIDQEYRSNIDRFSQDVIIAQLDLLLTYSERYYHRQFITRKITNHQILNRLEEILTTYFNSDALATKGLPTVQYVADTLNVSPGYLSSMLKTLTGQSTQQHIHDKLIEKAKEKLSITELSVSEIAYALGFEHPQSFSKLFKNKMKVTPLEYRQSFN